MSKLSLVDSGITDGLSDDGKKLQQSSLCEGRAKKNAVVGGAMYSASVEFQAAMRARGLEPPSQIIAGKLHRFPGAGKRAGNTAGWCKLFVDGNGGVFGDYSQDLSDHWSADKLTTFSVSQREDWVRKIKETKDQVAAEKIAVEVEAAQKAKAIWQMAQPATKDHPYLLLKGIDANGAKVHNGKLVIPLSDGTELRSLQFIGPDGLKLNLAGGRKKGCFHIIGNPRGATALCVAEGFATAATIHQATKLPVAAALDAGNLEAAAVALRKKYSNHVIVVCGDDDAYTPGNPGLTSATVTARAVSGKVVLPNFGESRPDGATDFNDMAKHRGIDAVREAIVVAVATPLPRHQSPEDCGLNGVQARERFVTLQSASEIEPEAISWTWTNWLATGKFHLLGGAPGTGKSTLAIAMAATISIGGRWPDGTQAEVGNVLIWSGEDDHASTLVPRLIAMGANLERVRFVIGTDGKRGKLPFDPSQDVPRLAEAAHAIGNVRLLVVDPVISTIVGNANSNVETRRGLQPLVDLGAALGCAVLGITHFTKGTGGNDPVERITGSLAFAALARVVLVAAKKSQTEEGEMGRLLSRAKSNVGVDGGGFAYDLAQTELVNYPDIHPIKVVWGNELEGSARDMLALADLGHQEEAGALKDACDFLIKLLQGEPVSAKDVQAAAKEAGISWATVRRAKATVGVKTTKNGMNGGWMWQCPGRCP